MPNPKQRKPIALSVFMRATPLATLVPRRRPIPQVEVKQRSRILNAETSFFHHGVRTSISHDAGVAVRAENPVDPGARHSILRVPFFCGITLPPWD